MINTALLALLPALALAYDGPTEATVFVQTKDYDCDSNGKKICRPDHPVCLSTLRQVWDPEACMCVSSFHCKYSCPYGFTLDPRVPCTCVPKSRVYSYYNCEVTTVLVTPPPAPFCQKTVADCPTPNFTVNLETCECECRAQCSSSETLNAATCQCIPRPQPTPVYNPPTVFYTPRRYSSFAEFLADFQQRRTLALNPSPYAPRTF